MIYLFFVFFVFFAFLHLFATFCCTFLGSSVILLLPMTFLVVTSCFCMLMHFCLLLLVDSCFPPFQNSVATFVYCLFLLSLLYRVLILCSARITSAGLSKLFDLRSTIILATSLFFSTPVKKVQKTILSTSCWYGTSIKIRRFRTLSTELFQVLEFV